MNLLTVPVWLDVMSFQLWTSILLLQDKERNNLPLKLDWNIWKFLRFFKWDKSFSIYFSHLEVNVHHCYIFNLSIHITFLKHYLKMFIVFSQPFCDFFFADFSVQNIYSKCQHIRLMVSSITLWFIGFNVISTYVCHRWNCHMKNKSLRWFIYC